MDDGVTQSARVTRSLGVDIAWEERIRERRLTGHHSWSLELERTIVLLGMEGLWVMDYGLWNHGLSRIMDYGLRTGTGNGIGLMKRRTTPCFFCMDDDDKDHCRWLCHDVFARTMTMTSG